MCREGELSTSCVEFHVEFDENSLTPKSKVRAASRAEDSGRGDVSGMG